MEEERGMREIEKGREKIAVTVVIQKKTKNTYTELQAHRLYDLVGLPSIRYRSVGLLNYRQPDKFGTRYLAGKLSMMNLSGCTIHS